ncbi:hypothetical protein ACH5RR_031705 [Cinchona calisaya]|uniref:F-box domain-containing protein n=1 Tax=Cinchona calisaya TaxID=153742 RepID=A0ABD2YG02_9GENT
MRLFKRSSRTSVQDLNPKPLPNIPDDLIEQILLKLPVKSLLRFKCVSKSWFSLISSKQFIQNHLNLSSNDLIFGAGYPFQFELKRTALQSALLFNARFLEATDINCPMKKNIVSPRIIGSSNGLVCIGVDPEDLHLWNPSTGKFKKLPDPNFRSEYFSSSSLFWFGYDKVNEDYKVVGIRDSDRNPFNKLIDMLHNQKSNFTEFKLYSRKTDSWKSIEDYKYDNGPLPQQCAFLHGKLHFIVDNYINREEDYLPKLVHKIVSFDLANETFGEVGQPDPNFHDRSLGVLGGCLSFLNNPESKNDGMDVWMMMEYGVIESWTKVCFIPFAYNPGRFIVCAPVFLSKNGEILLKFDQYLVLFNPKIGSRRYFQIPLRFGEITVDMYVESLVSPDDFP